MIKQKVNILHMLSYVDRMPKAGETLHSNSFATSFGGKGANQCVCAARLGSKVAMVGKVGSDPYGIKYRSQLDVEGVDTQFLEVAGDHSGVALIVVSSDGQNQIVINANANQFLSPEDCSKAQFLMNSAKVSFSDEVQFHSHSHFNSDSPLSTGNAAASNHSSTQRV
jgi:ribokinase